LGSPRVLIGAADIATVEFVGPAGGARVDAMLYSATWTNGTKIHRVYSPRSEMAERCACRAS